MKHSRREYNRHLKSEQYRKLRGRVLFRDFGMCQAIVNGKKCGSKIGVEVHHLTYARFGNEHINDLITLCERCHTAIHNHHHKRQEK